MSTDIQIETFNTDYSYRKNLTWKSINTKDTGQYECRANVINGDSFETRSSYVRVFEPQHPEIDISNLDQTEMRKSLGEPLRLQCKFTGIPVPAVRWFKDEALFEPKANHSRIGLFDKNTMLDIKYIKMEDEGKYRCEGANRLGSVSRSTSLKITSKLCGWTTLKLCLKWISSVAVI